MTVIADFLMVMHFAWAAFMVIGLPLGLITGSPVLRWTHFWGMVVTAFFAGAGMYCPLTTWEEALRQRADQGFSYEGSFLAHHLAPILYPRMEAWILRSISVLWGGLTVVTMIVLKPGRRKQV